MAKKKQNIKLPVADLSPAGLAAFEPRGLAEGGSAETAKVKIGGLECRDCGCKWLPVDRTVRIKDKIIRYRHCHNCGKTMTTRETVIGEEPPKAGIDI